MKQLLFIVSIIATTLWAGSYVYGQQKSPHKPVKLRGKSYLSGTQISGGTVTRAALDTLLRLPLVVRDNTGKEFAVAAFYFTYMERGVFEDSTGHTRIMTDYLGAHSDKGKIPGDWRKSLQSHIKEGDTVLFSDIAFYVDTGKNATLYYSTPIRLVIKP